MTDLRPADPTRPLSQPAPSGETERRALLKVLDFAHEWAAKYPLGGGADKEAAETVYRACEEARAAASPPAADAPPSAALERLHDLVHHGDMPHYPNLPQIDLASRAYVVLASAVDREFEKAAAPSREPASLPMEQVLEIDEAGKVHDMGLRPVSLRPTSAAPTHTDLMITPEAIAAMTLPDTSAAPVVTPDATMRKRVSDVLAVIQTYVSAIGDYIADKRAYPDAEWGAMVAALEALAARLSSPRAAVSDELFTKGDVMRAMELAVESCAEQWFDDALPSEAWMVDYAKHLATTTERRAARHAVPPSTTETTK